MINNEWSTWSGKELVSWIRANIVRVMTECDKEEMSRMEIFWLLFPKDDEEGPHKLWHTFKFRGIGWLHNNGTIESRFCPEKKLIFFKMCV